MTFKFPDQTKNRWFEVAKVIDENHVAVVGVMLGRVAVPGAGVGSPGRVAETLWYPPFVIKSPTKGLVDEKKLSLTKTYKVIGTTMVHVRKFSNKTVYIIEAEQ